MAVIHDPLIGRTIRGSIEIIKRIGEGGMGFVYEAYQTNLERKLAVKVMTPEHARNPVAAEYFLREAQSAARLRHPNIIQIIDFGKDGDDLLFLAMEFVPGAPLAALIEHAYPLDRLRVIELFIQTLSGLEEAHAQHIVHRDLKPDNLMIETTRSGSDRVKILDFGIAHMRDHANKKGGVLTQQNAVLGTPHYMSPEQARGERVDGRSDLFSMGIILYEVLTRQRPFEGKNMPEILMRVMTHQPVPPSVLCMDVEIDPGLEAICLRALRKEEALRYQSATEFRRALEAVRQEVALAKPEVASAKFIFKRRGERSRSGIKPLSGEVMSPAQSAPQGAGSAPTAIAFEAPAELGGELSDAHVVNISALFDRMTEGDEEAAAPTKISVASAPHTPAPHTHTTKPDAAPAITPPRSASPFGVEVEALREDLLGELRHVSVMVLHQRMYGALGAEEVFEINDEVEAILQGMCERFGAQVQSRQGGYYTIFLGFSKPAEDDATRAAELALGVRAMCQRFSSKSVAFALALSSGEVFCPGKAIERAAGTPLTSATEAAQKAADNEIVVPDVALQEQLSARFVLGKPLAHGERALISPRSHDDLEGAPSYASHDALVGREQEIAAVLGALGRLNRQHGGLLCVTGEAGMGKSALLAQAQHFASQRDIMSLRARHIYGGAHGLRDCMRQWTRDALRHLAIPDGQVIEGLTAFGLSTEYARLLDGVLHDQLDALMMFQGSVKDLQAASNSERAVEVALRRLLSMLSEKHKVLCVIDEVVALDEQLQGLIERLMAHLSDRPVLCMVAVRTKPGDPPVALPSSVTLVHVEALKESESAALLAALIERDVPGAFVKKLTRLSAGIPLQIKQLAQIVKGHPEGSISQVEAQLAESHDVSTLMRLRLFSLSSEAQNVLAVLSVLGDATSADMLLDLASSSWQPEEAMQRLYDQGFLEVEEHVQGARLFFTPPAMRMVVYKNLSSKNRAKVHERAARYLHDRLERHGELGVDERLALAHHLEHLQRLDLAIEHVQWLYAKAFRSFQYHDASELLDRLKRLAHAMAPEDVQSQTRYELDVARIEFVQGNLKGAIDRVLRLDRSGVVAHPLDIEVRLELARQWLEHEDPMMLEGMLQTLVKKLRRAEQDPATDWMRARAMCLLATTFEKQNKLTQAAQMLLEAIDFIEIRELSAHHNPMGPSLIWEPLNQLGRVRLKSQDMPGAFKMFELALNSAQHFKDQLGEITVRGNIAALHGMQERHEEGARQIATALVLARKTGQVRDVAKLLYNQGLMWVRQRRHELARGVFEESEEMCRELDWREGLAMNVNQLRALDQLAVPRR